MLVPSPTGILHKCDGTPECFETVSAHRWGQTKADDWFFSRDERTAFCPNHLPAWVGPWREKKARKADGNS